MKNVKEVVKTYRLDEQALPKFMDPHYQCDVLLDALDSHIGDHVDHNGHISLGGVVEAIAETRQDFDEINDASRYYVHTKVWRNFEDGLAKKKIDEIFLQHHLPRAKSVRSRNV